MWIVDQVQTTWDCLVFPNHLSVQDSLIVLVYPFTFLAVRISFFVYLIDLYAGPQICDFSILCFKGLFVVGLASWTRVSVHNTEIFNSLSSYRYPHYHPSHAQIKKCLNQTFQRGTRHVHFRVLFRTFVLHRGFSVVIIPIFLLVCDMI